MVQQRILVTYTGEFGSTAGVARDIAETLSAAGGDLELRPMAEADLSGFSAAILGGAIQYDTWMPGARAFLARKSKCIKRASGGLLFYLPDAFCEIRAGGTPGEGLRAKIAGSRTRRATDQRRRIRGGSRLRQAARFQKTPGEGDYARDGGGGGRLPRLAGYSCLGKFGLPRNWSGRSWPRHGHDF